VERKDHRQHGQGDLGLHSTVCCSLVAGREELLKEERRG
jgi:hypothetical protein